MQLEVAANREFSLAQGFIRRQCLVPLKLASMLRQGLRRADS